MDLRLNDFVLHLLIYFNMRRRVVPEKALYRSLEYYLLYPVSTLCLRQYFNMFKYNNSINITAMSSSSWSWPIVWLHVPDPSILTASVHIYLCNIIHFKIPIVVFCLDGFPQHLIRSQIPARSVRRT